MLRREEIERLSMLLEGELDEAESNALRLELAARPDLREAMERLVALSTLTGTDGPLVDAAIARALSPAQRPYSRWLLGLAATLVVLAGAAWWFSSVRAGAHDAENGSLATPAAPVAKEVRPAVRTSAGTQLSERDGAYYLSAGTALFDGDAEVVVAKEHLHVHGRALITAEPSIAISHVTDLVAPNPEVYDMIHNAKAQWLTAVFAVMVFQGEVLAADTVSAGTSYAKQPALTAPVARLEPETSEGVVVAAVRARRADFEKCFSFGIKTTPHLRGGFTSRFTISAAGDVSDATIDEAYSLQNPFVASCVLEKLSTMKFAATQRSTDVAYDFSLKREEGEAEEAGCATCAHRASERSERVAIDVGDSPAVGPPDAKVTVILFSEAECSFCVQAHAVLKKLEAEYAGRVRFVYKHFPTPSHPGARKAALALQAAHAQGRFWDFLDSAYADPTETSGGLYDAKARALGLDLQRYRRAVSSVEAAAAVDADLAAGKKAGVQGVPSWFINGSEVVGFRPVGVMRELIDAELK